ncbi:hypothetical protein B0A50_07394 [Salinomyces thailandicus]|uniref:Uncharacterized protein n=1 Tax=Salinomyces thailandicus TaxID=706561 RepID=A0A4U0TMH3_9PEZI|nr:hypothetical protein B0A50_07394 [Salinomyces thailandica]
MEVHNIEIAVTYPNELHYIKALFLQKHYRQCVQACRDILKAVGEDLENRPLQQVFISFYLGLAHNELARSMHDYSQTKVSAFDQAEQYFGDALQALQLVRESSSVREAPQPVDDDQRDPFVTSPRPATANSQQTQCSSEDDYDPFNYSSPSYALASCSDSSGYLRADDLPVRSPPAASRESSGSNLTDLDSHSSFGQIMTPHRVLERDISRMSLIDELPPKRPSGLPRTTSTSQSLLKPIRPGSPTTAKAFNVPPRLPHASNASNRRSLLPQLATCLAPHSTPTRIHDSWFEEDAASPSPVSPLRSNDGDISENSTISPISPDTAFHHYKDGDASFQSSPDEESVGDTVAHRERTVAEHLVATQVQLISHLSMLEKARDATISTQKARAAQRATSTAPTVGTPLPRISGNNMLRSSGMASKQDSVISADSRRIPQTRSFWSFKPADVKAEEKRARIEAGRQRGWVKERFQPGRYQELAEKAMAELW